MGKRATERAPKVENGMAVMRIMCQCNNGSFIAINSAQLLSQYTCVWAAAAAAAAVKAAAKAAAQ